ncbi:MAG: hypothetical protein FWE50_03650 [Alphaproteobacteria bacterium]|nr:hypothetical protein [Alphaproteobacteria bacterium]
MIKEFESEITRDARLAIEYVLNNKVKIHGLPIQNVRGQVVIVGDKLPIEEKNKFSYYKASLVLISPIQHPEILKDRADTITLRFSDKIIKKYKIKHPDIWVSAKNPNISENPGLIIAEKDGLQSYGNTIDHARAYLSIAIFDEYITKVK